MVVFLFLFSIIAYLLLPTFIKMWQKMLKRHPSERAKRAEYVRIMYLYALITYLLLSLLLARYVRDTCFVLEWCLHGTCLGFACYLICICWHSFRESHVCVCLYVYLLLPRFINMCPQLFKRPPTERMKRAEYVRLIHVLRIDHLLITYLLLT